MAWRRVGIAVLATLALTAAAGCLGRNNAQLGTWQLPCASDSGCSDGEVCRDAVCRATCTISAECGAAETCAAGACSPVIALAVPAVCGDGLVEGNEGCDDGNGAALDGCDASCAV